VYKACTHRQQLLLGTSSKLDKSVLIGTLPLTRAPAVAKSPNGYWIGTCVNACTQQATAAVIRDQQQARQVSIDWDPPLTEPRC
jgi:hypothetical protein